MGEAIVQIWNFIWTNLDQAFLAYSGPVLCLFFALFILDRIFDIFRFLRH